MDRGKLRAYHCTRDDSNACKKRKGNQVMKKILTYLLLVSCLFALTVPFTTLAAIPNTSAVSNSTAVGSEVGGVVPATYKGMLNSGATFDLNAKLTIETLERSGNNVVVTLYSAGLAGPLNTRIGNVFFAIYDANGRLKSVSENANALVGAKVYTWADVDFGAGTKIKAFVWDSETYVPLCDAKEN